MDTACTSTDKIWWSCNCSGRPDTMPVQLTVGGQTYQGCIWNDDVGEPVICLPIAKPAAVNNGDPVTVVYSPPAPGEPCHSFTGILIGTGDDWVFCNKQRIGTEVTCPVSFGTNVSN